MSHPRSYGRFSKLYNYYQKCHLWTRSHNIKQKSCKKINRDLCYSCIHSSIHSAMAKKLLHAINQPVNSTGDPITPEEIGLTSIAAVEKTLLEKGLAGRDFPSRLISIVCRPTNADDQHVFLLFQSQGKRS